MRHVYQALFHWPFHSRSETPVLVASPLGRFVGQIKPWHVLCLIALAVQVYLFRSYEIGCKCSQTCTGQATAQQGSYASLVTSHPRVNENGADAPGGINFHDGQLGTSGQIGQDSVFSQNQHLQPQQQEVQQQQQQQLLVNYAPRQVEQLQQQQQPVQDPFQPRQQEQQPKQNVEQEEQEEPAQQQQQQQQQDQAPGSLSNQQDEPRPRYFTGVEDSQPHLVAHDTCNLETLGGRKKDGYGAWTLCTNHVRPGGIVYSFGIGGDVSFDNEMLNRGHKVFGFDPTVTPEDVSSLFQSNHDRDQPSTFQFCQVGIGPVNGVITFFRPKNPRIKSMTAVSHEQLSGRYERQGMPAPVLRLPTFMCTNGHGFIDVLKVDVEGVEFDICDDWLRMGTPLPVGQVLLEFHDRLLRDGKVRKRACYEAMAREGFTEVYVSRNKEEVTFARLAIVGNISKI
ncbi:hypothetical protein CLOM_g17412 [Closterium sp. NIES-68]|nr:hypothetical protein CLOM_g17412 [Closterium sp. NIES-68]GJP68049.1 hypothetical protein CLOP_g24803 [Closterium sp. NIES-67]